MAFRTVPVRFTRPHRRVTAGAAFRRVPLPPSRDTREPRPIRPPPKFRVYPIANSFKTFEIQMRHTITYTLDVQHNNTFHSDKRAKDHKTICPITESPTHKCQKNRWGNNRSSQNKIHALLARHSKAGPKTRKKCLFYRFRRDRMPKIPRRIFTDSTSLRQALDEGNTESIYQLFS